MDSNWSADIVILTVLPEEYEAVRSKLTPPDVARHVIPNPYAWEIGEIKNERGGSYLIALGMLGQAGNVTSAIATMEAVRQFSPRYVFFVGIAGGLDDELSLGDVVIAEQIYGYEYGKLDRVFSPRRKAYSSNRELLVSALALAGAQRNELPVPTWMELISVEPPEERRPRAVKGDLASGEKVVDNPDHQFFRRVRTAWPGKLHAVEMEGAGIAAAIKEVNSHRYDVRFLVIRGISDMPRPPGNQLLAWLKAHLSQLGLWQEREVKGTRERDTWKAYAAEVAAAFSVGLIAHRLPESPRFEARNRYLHDLIDQLAPGPKGLLSLGEYVDLPLELVRNTAGRDPSQKERVRNLRAIRNRPNKLVILGSTGSGKTTALRKFAADIAKDCLSDEGHPLPILIELWEWHASVRFDVFLANATAFSLLSQLGTPAELVANREVVICLDGLDELADAKVRILRDWITKSSASVWLTCRTDDHVGIRQLNLPTAQLLPLEKAQIWAFALRFLGEAEAEGFVSSIFAQEGGSPVSNEQGLLGLARMPFFLLLILQRYQIGGWQRTPNRWDLIRFVVEQLWEKSKRVQEQLAMTGLGQYTHASEVTRALSKLAPDFLLRSSISRDLFEQSLPDPLMKILGEAGLVRLSSDRMAFRHSLFADYFAAERLLSSGNLATFARHAEVFAGALVTLADYSPEERERVARALLSAFSESEDLKYELGQGLLWAMAEVCDEGAADVLVKRFRDQKPEGSLDHLKAAARLVNRLPEDSRVRNELVEILSQVLMQDPGVETKEIMWYSGLRLGEIAALFSHYTDAAEALAEIQSDSSAKLLMGGFYKFVEWFRDCGIPGLFHASRHEFAVYLSRIGKPAIPLLIDAARQEDLDIAVTAAEALSWTSASIPRSQLVPILAGHLIPLVRFHAALALGNPWESDNIQFLISALNDDGLSWTGSAGPYLGINPAYFYVADGAAAALASIDDPRSQSALFDHDYTEDGLWTIPLLLQRLESSQEVNPAGDLRTQWARFLVGMAGGLEALLPRMGHLGVDRPGKCPVYRALIQRYEGLNERPEKALLTHVEQSTDPTSRSLALLLLAEMGSPETATMMRRIVVADSDPVVRGAAAGALMILHAKDIAEYTEGEIRQVVDISGGTLGIMEHGVGRAVGWGFARLAQASSEVGDGGERAQKLIQDALSNLVDHVEGDNVRTAHLALETLEHFVGAAGHKAVGESLSKNILSAIDQSPSYYMMKASTQLHQATHDPEAYGKALKLLRRVDELKSEKRAAWAIKFTEAEWQSLGCADADLYFALGDAYNGLEQPGAARTAYLQCINLIRDENATIGSDRPRLTRALIKVANTYYPDDPQEAYPFVLEALEIAREQQHIELTFDSSYALMHVCMRLEKWDEAIEVGEGGNQIADEIPRDFERKANLLLGMSTANEHEGKLETALEQCTDALHLAKRYGLIDQRLRGLTQRILLCDKLGDIEAIDVDTREMVQMYDALQDWPSAAETMIKLADLGFGNRLQMKLTYYQLGLDCLEKAGPEADSDLKIYVPLQMARTFEKAELTEQAEASYISGLQLMEQEAPGGIYAAGLIEYGRFLARLGRNDEAEKRVLQAGRLLSELGLDTSDAERAIAEVAVNPEWRIPNPILSSTISRCLMALSYKPEELAELRDDLANLRDAAGEQGWDDEVQLFAALIAICDDFEWSLAADNPYFDRVQALEGSLPLTRSLLEAFPEHFKAVLSLIRSASWREFGSIIELDSSLLEPAADQILEALAENSKILGKYSDHVELMRKRTILQMCRERGTQIIISRLVDPPQLMKTVMTLAQQFLVSPEMRTLEDSLKLHPELLSREADEEIELALRFAQIQGDPMSAGLYVFLWETLRLLKEMDLDRALDWLGHGANLQDASVQLILAPDWRRVREILELHPDLLSPTGKSLLNTGIEAALRGARYRDDSEMELKLLKVSMMVDLCHVFGTRMAFDKLLPEFEDLIDFVHAIGTANPDLVKQVLLNNPELLSRDSRANFESSREEAQRRGDERLESILSFQLELLEKCNELGVDEALRQVTFPRWSD